MYGLVKYSHLDDITLEVVNCLGNGSNNTAIKLLKETAQVETGSGTIRDATELAGMGITQFDWIGFKDTLDRTKRRNKDKVLKYFGIDIDWVKWEELRYNPLLAIIFTRLKYKLKEISPEPKKTEETEKPKNELVFETHILFIQKFLPKLGYVDRHISVASLHKLHEEAYGKYSKLKASSNG